MLVKFIHFAWSCVGFILIWNIGLFKHSSLYSSILLSVDIWVISYFEYIMNVI